MASGPLGADLSATPPDAGHRGDGLQHPARNPEGGNTAALHHPAKNFCPLPEPAEEARGIRLGFGS